MTILEYSKVIALSLLVAGCASGTRVTNIDHPLSQIQEAVKKNLPARLHSTSVNGREFHTHPFRVPLEFRRKALTPDGPPPERAYAKYTILGVTMPYTIEVRVDIEELVSAEGDRPRYVICCRNKEMEQALATQVYDYLVKRVKDSNFIDDFRPF